MHAYAANPFALASFFFFFSRAGSPALSAARIPGNTAALVFIHLYGGPSLTLAVACLASRLRLASPPTPSQLTLHHIASQKKTQHPSLMLCKGGTASRVQTLKTPRARPTSLEIKIVFFAHAVQSKIETETNATG